MGLKEKRRENKTKKVVKHSFKGLETGISYSIVGKSEFLVNLVLGHIVAMNLEEDWDFESSIYGKYMEISDTLEPIKDEKIIFSKKIREGFPVIDLDEDFLDIFYYILLDGEEIEDFKIYIKKHLAKKPPELVFYYIFAMIEVAIQDGEFNFKKAEYVLHHYKYKGVHTYLDKVRAVVTFVKTPSEKHLSELMLILDEEQEPYASLIHIISAIANNTLPKFVNDKYSNLLEDMNFQKNILKVSVAILQSETQEDFILTLVKGIIYS